MRNFTFVSLFLGALAVACGGVTTSLGSDVGEQQQAKDGDAPSLDAGTPSTGNDASPIDGGSATACGAVSGDPPPLFGYCPQGSYCDQGAGKCHSKGACRPITAPPANGCAALVPVCGCDGKDYCDGDDAQRNGVVVAGPGGCKFDCGATQCNSLTEYCEHAGGGIPLPDGGVNEWWTCKTLPSSCLYGDDRSCACMKRENVVFGACEDKNGHVNVAQFLP